jgi:hypothetical protein
MTNAQRQLSQPASMTRRCCVLSGVTFAVSGCASIEGVLAPGRDLWPRWTTHDESSSRTVDHASYEALLQRYLADDGTGLNRFAYADVTASDRAALERYLGSLSSIEISRYARREQLPYWINLYNALTLNVVLAHYPVRSILDIDISPGLLAQGPFDKKLIAVEGQSLSLNDVEHRILRPIWNDPRLHYTVNCASVGCPNLQTVAFTPANTGRLLEDGAKAYVNHPRGVRVSGKSAVASKIYNWFAEDFGGSEAGVIAHLRQHAAPALSEALGRAEIARYEYDWTLNDARRAQPRASS